MHWTAAAGLSTIMTIIPTGVVASGERKNKLSWRSCLFLQCLSTLCSNVHSLLSSVCNMDTWRLVAVSSHTYTTYSVYYCIICIIYAGHCCLASVKSRLVLPFWYRPTRVVLEKGPLNGCMCVCVPLLMVRRCNGKMSVHPSVCLSRRSIAPATCSWLAPLTGYLSSSAAGSDSCVI